MAPGEEKSLEENLQLPPPPDISLKMAKPVTIIGNAFFLILSALYVMELIGHIAILITTFIAIGFISQRDEYVKKILKEQYVTQRFVELSPHLQDAEEALRTAEAEFKKLVEDFDFGKVATAIGFISFFFLLYFSYYRVGEHLADLQPILKQIVSGVLCLLFTLWMTVFWFIFNSVYAMREIDFKKIREGTPWVNKLIDSDHNDIILINRSTKLNSIKMRAETLTHESVLFSALSFSAFLSLVISDLFDIKKLRFEESTFSRIYYYSEIVVSGKIRESNIDFPNLLRVNAVDIISVFLLLCATFFLCTIIARARFNDRYHDAENLLSAAQKLNEKEEEALRAGKDEEKIKYNAAIYNMIDSIEKLESSLIVPVIQMRINRNIGLLCFMICLVVCGNMFSIYIAGGIIFILTFSIGAAVIDNIWRDLLRGAVFDENGILKLLNPVSKRP